MGWLSGIDDRMDTTTTTKMISPSIFFVIY